MIHRVKIVSVPYFSEMPVSSVALAPVVLPLGMTMVTGALRSAGYEVDQDDLNVKVHHDNYLKKGFVDESVFLKPGRVMEFVKGRQDAGILKAAQSIIRKTSWEGYDAFLFSCYTAKNLTSMMVLLSIVFCLRKIFSDIPFICGGPYFPEYVTDDLFGFFRKYGLVDFIIHGPAEEGVVLLLKNISSGGSLRGVPGLIYAEEGRVLRNPLAHPPKPGTGDFDGLDMSLYRHVCKGRYARKELGDDEDMLVLPYVFTNGCPHRCAFCFSPPVNKFAFKDVGAVMDDLKSIRDKYRTSLIYFKDATFNFSYDYTRRLCQEMIRDGSGFRWSACVHAGCLDEELLALMKKAGAIRLIYGFETGSRKLQKYIKKELDLKHLQEVLKVSDALGIWNGLDILCGIPYEDKDDVQATISFLSDNARWIDEVHVASFRLAAQSSFAADPQQYGLTNIRHQNMLQVLQSLCDSPTESRVVRYIFDEKKGLPWRQKQGQISSSYTDVVMSVRRAMVPVYENISYLFYFYNRLHGKKDIKRVYNRYARILRRSAFFRSPRFVLNEIAKIRDLRYAFRRLVDFLS